MSITHIASVSELESILSKSKDRITVIDFHATWCGPCHAIAPTYEALSKQYKTVNFLKCDVDAAKDVASRYAVSAMPTFVFLKNGSKIDQVRGANKAALDDALRRHASPSSSGAFTGKGQTLGGGPAPIDKTDVKNAVDQVTGTVNSLDPQLKVLACLLGAYLLFLVPRLIVFIPSIIKHSIYRYKSCLIVYYTSHTKIIQRKEYMSVTPYQFPYVKLGKFLKKRRILERRVLSYTVSLPEKRSRNVWQSDSLT